MTNKKTFESYVREGFDSLPTWVKEEVHNVALIVEDEPSAEVRSVEGLDDDETLLGYYHGVPLTERGDGYGIGETYPDRITIYKKTIIDAAGGDPEKIKTIVTETIWHEFAHYFGMNEEEVRMREKVRGGE